MRLLTWNIQWGRGMDGRVDFVRIADVIASHGEFDVICLQEVAVNFQELAGSRGEDQVSELYRLFPSHLPVYGPAVDAPAVGGGRKLFGNLILSRLPVAQVFRHLLPWPADSSVPSMQRLLLEAVVEAEFGPVRVMTTHLEYYSRAQRMAQVEAIRAAHMAACAHACIARPAEAKPGPFSPSVRPASAILCGDMNAGPDAPERKRLLENFEIGTPAFKDAWETVHPALPHAPTAGIHPVDWLDAPSCYDFIYVTDDLAGRLARCEVDAETAASDHQPVWIEMR